MLSAPSLIMNDKYSFRRVIKYPNPLRKTTYARIPKSISSVFVKRNYVTI